ncbi:MAG TPA: SUMF1/EgtB/PvdO family nonheme iron enzyme [Desulfomonilaceae bacterium]|nr:SUMF1/EgtB/PvdO family nonheme iron enzyme [Desulfomonilaceae bacterium]
MTRNTNSTVWFALEKGALFLVLLPFLILAFPAYVHPASGGTGVQMSSNGESEKNDVHPSLLYESVAGYLDGFRKQTSRKRKAAEQKQRRVSKVAGEPEDESASVREFEVALAERRDQRREWNLVVTSVERILNGDVRIASAADVDKLTGMLRTAKEKTEQTGLQPGVRGETVNSVGMRMVLVQPGSFEMGNSTAETRRIQTEWNAEENLLTPETPNHQVRINRAFLMGKYPVTIGDFKKFVSETGYRTTAEKQGWAWAYSDSKKHWAKKSGAFWKNPGTKVWDDHPVTMVSYQDAEAFCDWLSQKEKRKYYVPSEAQWEYAARGGKEGQRFPWGNEYPDSRKANLADRRSDVPWADRTLDDGYGGTSPVGNYEPNGFWLYDMVGNVWQYCSDFYDAKPYDTSLVDDPVGPRTGKKKVVRGGNWAFGAGIARTAFRFGLEPDLCIDIAGFRVAAVPGATEDLGDSSNGNPLTNEHVRRLMDRIKDLVSGGRRMEAQKLLDTLGNSASETKGSPTDPVFFVKNVLQSFIDTSPEKNLPSFTNSLGMKMVRLPAGNFVMGSSESDIAWAMNTLAQGQPVTLENEYPFHKVRISRPFFIAATEVTVAQFEKFVEETGYVTDAEDEKGGEVFNGQARRFQQKSGTSWKNPGWTVSPDEPVVMVSWNDAQAFVEWLAAKEKLPYKLPTEAQWEYAARGGIPMAPFPWGDELPDGRRANYADKNKDFEWRDRNADGGYKYVAPVGSYEANGFGLYDMAGNALEWVRDYYGEDYYRYSPEIDPEGPGHGENRVMKGGEWTFGAVNLRCAFRGWARPDLAIYNGGFRVAIEFSVPQHMFHFSNDFLTKQWVPGSDQRHVALAVSREKERGGRTAPKKPEVSSAKTDTKDIEELSVKGLMVIDFSPRSDARKAGLQKGDVIIEYNGYRDLTADEFIALTGVTKRQKKVRPLLVFIRDGYEYGVKLPPGLLGISVMDTTIRGPFKRPEPVKETPVDTEKDKKAKHPDWT